MYEILYYLNLNYKGKNLMNKKILGMGNAVLDIVSSVSDDFLVNANLTKGAMTLVDQNVSDKILKKSIAIPILINQSKKDLNKISNIINNFFQKKK